MKKNTESKQGMKNRADRMFARNLKALREIAKQYGLKVIKASDTTANEGIGFRIGEHLGLAMDRRAGYVIAGTKGYISNHPHGENYHSMGLIFDHGFEWDQDGPGYGSEKDWQAALSNAPFFGGVIFSNGFSPWADNVGSDPKQIAEFLKSIGAMGVAGRPKKKKP